MFEKRGINWVAISLVLCVAFTIAAVFTDMPARGLLGGLAALSLLVMLYD